MISPHEGNCQKGYRSFGYAVFSAEIRARFSRMGSCMQGDWKKNRVYAAAAETNFTR